MHAHKHGVCRNTATTAAAAAAAALAAVPVPVLAAAAAAATAAAARLSATTCFSCDGPAAGKPNVCLYAGKPGNPHARCLSTLLLLVLVTMYACRYSFFDTDNMIELAHNKMPVSDIFKQYGEEYFRSCERQVGGGRGWVGGGGVSRGSLAVGTAAADTNITSCERQVGPGTGLGVGVQGSLILGSAAAGSKSTAAAM
jgi:hypothetical protein